MPKFCPCKRNRSCMVECLLSRFSYVLFVTPWTVAHQAPQSMGFSRQEYWSGLPCPPPEDLPDPGIETIFQVQNRVPMHFPGSTSGKEPTCQCRRHKRCSFSSRVGENPWRRAWQPTPVFLPGESHGQRSLADCSPWGHSEPDTTEVAKHTYSLRGLNQ